MTVNCLFPSILSYTFVTVYKDIEFIDDIIDKFFHHGEFCVSNNGFDFCTRELFVVQVVAVNMVVFGFHGRTKNGFVMY